MGTALTCCLFSLIDCCHIHEDIRSTFLHPHTHIHTQMTHGWWCIFAKDTSTCGDRTADHLVVGCPTLPPEPQTPKCSQQAEGCKRHWHNHQNKRCMTGESVGIHCSAKCLVATHGASFKAEGQLAKHVSTILTSFGVFQTMNISLQYSVRGNMWLPLVAFQNHKSQD